MSERGGVRSEVTRCAKRSEGARRGEERSDEWTVVSYIGGWYATVASLLVHLVVLTHFNGLKFVRNFPTAIFS